MIGSYRTRCESTEAALPAASVVSPFDPGDDRRPWFRPSRPVPRAQRSAPAGGDSGSLVTVAAKIAFTSADVAGPGPRAQPRHNGAVDDRRSLVPPERRESVSNGVRTHRALYLRQRYGAFPLGTGPGSARTSASAGCRTRCLPRAGRRPSPWDFAGADSRPGVGTGQR